MFAFVAPQNPNTPAWYGGYMPCTPLPQYTACVPNYPAATMAVVPHTVSATNVVTTPVPWPMSPTSMASLHTSLSSEAEQLQLRPSTPPDQLAKVAPMDVTTADSSITTATHTSGKKGKKERDYDEAAFFAAVKRVLRGEASARRAASAAGMPSARRSISRYVLGVQKDHPAPRDTPAGTLAVRLDHVDAMALKAKGNPNYDARRLFSETEQAYFARALKIYADMGWPMDLQGLRMWFSDAAAEMKRVDWKTGQPYVVGRTFVYDFLKAHPELTTYKASNIDPLRAKKASETVSIRESRAPARALDGSGRGAVVCDASVRAHVCENATFKTSFYPCTILSGLLRRDTHSLCL